MLRAGDGGGAAVSEFVALQDGYAGSACAGDCEGAVCNSVLLIWNEDGIESTGVLVAMDGVELGTVDGLPPDQIPGANAVSIVGVEGGQRAFQIVSQDNGSTGTDSIMVVDQQPFSDPAPTCLSGPPDGPETCEMHVEVNPGPNQPSNYFVLFDGGLLGDTGQDVAEFGIGSSPTGEHCLALQGVHIAGNDTYLGCEVETCCMISCADTPCDPPRNLVVCQAGFGENPEDYVVMALWDSGGDAYTGGVEGYVNGELVGSVDGESSGAIFTTGPGEITIGVRGNCGADGFSDIVEDAVLTLPETPHTNPISGAVTCTFSPADGGTLTATWTNVNPSFFITVFLLSNGELFPVTTLLGDQQLVAVSPAQAEDQIVLQFFELIGENCYGSDVIVCNDDPPPPPPPPPPEGEYLAAVCNGGEKLNITSGVAVLNFLFRGTLDPPCVAACECNGDGSINVADALCVFGFLFQGKQAPAGWVSHQPPCVQLGTDDDCETPNPVCQ